MAAPTSSAERHFTLANGEPSTHGVLESQPFGSWLLGITALGLMAFGAFAFVEARWRRIRPPRDLTPG